MKKRPEKKRPEDVEEVMLEGKIREAEYQSAKYANLAKELKKKLYRVQYERREREKDQSK